MVKKKSKCGRFPDTFYRNQDQEEMLTKMSGRNNNDVKYIGKVHIYIYISDEYKKQSTQIFCSLQEPAKQSQINLDNRKLLRQYSLVGCSLQMMFFLLMQTKYCFQSQLLMKNKIACHPNKFFTLTSFLILTIDDLVRTTLYMHLKGSTAQFPFESYFRIFLYQTSNVFHV